MSPDQKALLLCRSCIVHPDLTDHYLFPSQPFLIRNGRIDMLDHVRRSRRDPELKIRRDPAPSAL